MNRVDGEHDGEIEAFHKEHRRRLRGHLIGKMGSPPNIADEIVNDAFLAVAIRWSRLRDDGQYPIAYLYKVAHNQWFKRSRMHAAEPVPLPSEESLPSQEVDIATAVSDRMHLEEALRDLHGRQCEAVTLRYIEGLDVFETAAIMGVSEGAVKAYAWRGLAKMRDFLNEDSDTTREGDQ